MKIAYVFCPIPHHGRLNGIISQCITWANGLRKFGHEVQLITAWETYNWPEFDVIHVFGSTDIWYYNFIKEMLKLNPCIVWSPICDNMDKPIIQHLKSLLGSQILNLFSLPYIRRLTYQLPIQVSVRSLYEREYISDSYNVPNSKFHIAPLGMSYNDDFTIGGKENFCFHLSTLYQPRKNVLRLVKAAKKYQFQLVLAGSMGNENEFCPIRDEIEGCDNIKVLGRVSEEEKLSLYKRAKVFALPSISEGVGIVALDAAHFGCDIVITNVGGPQEYYPDNLVWKVNPYSIDEIGMAIVSALQNTHQPQIKKYVDANYSEKSVIGKLLHSYDDLKK